MKPCGQITKAGKPCLVKIYSIETACRFHCKKPEIIAHRVAREIREDPENADREKLRAKVLALCRDCGDCQGCGRHPCNSCCIALGLRWRDIETLLKERA